MAADHAGLGAGLADALHRVDHDRVVVVARVSEVLREVSLPDEHDPDARYLLEHLGEVLDGADLLAHDGHEDLALGVERPDVGDAVVVLPPDAPVARRRDGRIASLAARLQVRAVRRARIAARGDGVARLLDGAHVRPDDAVDAEVQHLLGKPLVHLAAVRRDADERRDRRRQRSAVDDLLAVHQELEAVAQPLHVEGVVLHLEDDGVVAGGGQADRVLDLGAGEGGEGGPAGLQGLDDAVQPWQLGHG